MAISVETEWLVCTTCGILFGLTTRRVEDLTRWGHQFYCPNGHQQSFGSQTDTEKRAEAAEKRVAALQSSLSLQRERGDHWYANWIHADRRIASLKGVIARAKAAHGSLWQTKKRGGG